MAYAYIDNTEAEVLHVLDGHPQPNETDGAVVFTDIDHSGGYPVVSAEEIVYYHSTGIAYANGNKFDGVEIPVPREIQDLVTEIENA